jgi:hypothetical protein
MSRAATIRPLTVSPLAKLPSREGVGVGGSGVLYQHLVHQYESADDAETEGK